MGALNALLRFAGKLKLLEKTAFSKKTSITSIFKK